MINKINIKEAFSLFQETWTPMIGGEINHSHLKLAKFEGEFIWHSHEHEDELFLVINGRLRIEFRNQPSIRLEAGEYLIVPQGVEHKPVAELPTNVILIEPKSTVNTGDKISEKTILDLKRI